MESTILTKSIMRRVYAVWAVKKILSPRFVKLYLFALLLWQFLGRVSVLNVLENTPFANPGRSISFYTNAFWGTEFVVQALTFLMLGFFLWLFSDFRRGEHTHYVKIA